MSDDPESNFETVHQTNAKSWAFKQRLYKNPNLQKIIKNSLPTFDRLGLLDEMWWCKVIRAKLSYTFAIAAWKLSLFTFHTISLQTIVQLTTIKTKQAQHR